MVHCLLFKEMRLDTLTCCSGRCGWRWCSLRLSSTVNHDAGNNRSYPHSCSPATPRRLPSRSRSGSSCTAQTARASAGTRRTASCRFGQSTARTRQPGWGCRCPAKPPRPLEWSSLTAASDFYGKRLLRVLRHLVHFLDDQRVHGQPTLESLRHEHSCCDTTLQLLSMSFAICCANTCEEPGKAANTPTAYCASASSVVLLPIRTVAKRFSNAQMLLNASHKTSSYSFHASTYRSMHTVLATFFKTRISNLYRDS